MGYSREVVGVQRDRKIVQAQQVLVAPGVLKGVDQNILKGVSVFLSVKSNIFNCVDMQSDIFLYNKPQLFNNYNFSILNFRCSTNH